MAPPDDTYSHGHHASVLRSHGWRTAENSAAYLLPHLRPEHRLLDVGVGPGSITCDLASRLSHGSVVGIDNAAAAVEAAGQLAESRAVGNLTLTVGDVYALDFPDGSFDVVHAHQVLQHLSDPVAALREMRRVCRPDGVVAVRDADYAAMTWFPETPELTRWMSLYQALARSNRGEPDAGRRLKGWADQAGFDSISCTASTWCFASEEDLAWWSQTWAERLVSSGFAAQSVERGLSDPVELSALSEGWRAWSQEPAAWFAVVHGEALCRPVSY
ncbi:MAG TPA: methyltransferase domain-containing protein [Propionibacteriaceae bacterium]